MRNRLMLCKAFCVLAITVTVATGADTKSQNRPPNLILIMGR